MHTHIVWKTYMLKGWSEDQSEEKQTKGVRNVIRYLHTNFYHHTMQTHIAWRIYIPNSLYGDQSEEKKVVQWNYMVTELNCRASELARLTSLCKTGDWGECKIPPTFIITLYSAPVLTISSLIFHLSVCQPVHHKMFLYISKCCPKIHYGCFSTCQFILKWFCPLQHVRVLVHFSGRLPTVTPGLPLILHHRVELLIHAACDVIYILIKHFIISFCKTTKQNK
jgi:hypothetical protein